MLHVLEDGESAEAAVTGREGMIGLSLFLGGGTTTGRAVVYCPGHAYRLPAEVMKSELTRGSGLPDGILRFTQAFLTQMGQTGVCNRHHSIQQRLCRCLLLRLDRLSSDELQITQEQLAGILGVRRESVTEAAGNLRKTGVIAYRRGRIAVLDRPQLEQKVCECYRVVAGEYNRLLAHPGAAQRQPHRGRHVETHP